MKVLVIPDATTALAATRDGKIDFMDGVSLQNARHYRKRTLKLNRLRFRLELQMLSNQEMTRHLLTDIKVREAMQMHKPATNSYRLLQRHRFPRPFIINL